MNLEILSGGYAGRLYPVKGDTVVGRAEGVHVQMPDKSIAPHHARFTNEPRPMVFDLGANGVMVNGKSFAERELAEGDVVKLGEVEFLVHLGDVEHIVTAAQRRQKRVLILAISVVVLLGLLAGAGYLKMQQKKRLTEVLAREFFPERAMPGVRARIPLDDETKEYYFNVDVVMSRRDPVMTYGSKRRGYDATASLPLVEDYPPDPLTPGFDYARRGWGLLPPRLGNGRFLAGSDMVLGNYYVRGFRASVPGMFNPTPKAFLSRIGPETPLTMDFQLEVWEGLPEGAEIAFFSLDKPSDDLAFTRQPMTPRALNMLVPPADFLPRGEVAPNEQRARGFSMLSGERFRAFEIRQVKAGGTLVILTAQCHAWQQFRLGTLMQQFVEAQEIRPQTYEDGEARARRALELEREADELFPNVMSLEDVAAWNRVTDKAKFFRAFNRYHHALVELQRAGRWPYDDDYARIYAKALRIHQHTMDRESEFQTAFRVIESLRDELDSGRTKGKDRDALVRSLGQEIDALYDTTRRGMEPDLYPILDEWFIYSNIRRLQFASLR